MFSQFLAAFVGMSVGVSSAAVLRNQVVWQDAAHIVRRQMDASSVCTTYGVDFEDGGSYFINANSNASFTFVSKFDGCNNDTASLQLVNQDTSDQYDCGEVPTVPNNASQAATCQIRKDQLVPGNYLIIAIGNNGNGQPFALQRQFTIQVGPQMTTTFRRTAAITTTPVVTKTSISYFNSTVTAFNNLTVTEPGQTTTTRIAPSEIYITKTQTVTQIYHLSNESTSTTTTTVTPTCRLPSLSQLSYSLHRYRPKSIEQPGIFSVHNPVVPGREINSKRSPDSRVTTVTASGNDTVTVTAMASTETDVITATSTIQITVPPKTVVGNNITQTVTEPTPTKTITEIVYSQKYIFEGQGVLCTSTVTSTPAAEATECRRKGGHLEV